MQHILVAKEATTSIPLMDLQMMKKLWWRVIDVGKESNKLNLLFFFYSAYTQKTYAVQKGFGGPTNRQNNMNTHQKTILAGETRKKTLIYTFQT